MAATLCFSLAKHNEHHRNAWVQKNGDGDEGAFLNVNASGGYIFITK